MSRLREHLQTQKQAYAERRYAGDLAGDVLMPRMTIGRQLLIGASVAAGIAAMILITVWLRNPSTSGNERLAEAPANIEQESNSNTESIWLAFTIERPSNAQYAIAAVASTTNPSSGDASFSASIPAVWGFPTVSSLQEELSEETQSEEEAS